MEVIIIIVPGVPIPWMRPGVRRGRFYDRQKGIKEITRSWIRLGFPKSCLRPYISVPIDLEFVMPVPDSWPKFKKKDALEGKLRHTIKPDRDNLTKYIFDCLKGIVYHDDCQSDKGIEVKRYCREGEESHTSITVWLDRE